MQVVLIITVTASAMFTGYYLDRQGVKTGEWWPHVGIALQFIGYTILWIALG